MEFPSAYIPVDRRLAILAQTALPEHAEGTVLFADLSDFTALTEQFFTVLGPKRGVEQLTTQLNAIYGALIDAVFQWRGSVVGFGGDALTCWFDGDDGRSAIACSLAIQVAMDQWATIPINSEHIASFGIKIALASGPIRRFVVGDPEVQLMDMLAGAVLVQAIEAEQHAHRGDIIAGRDLAARFGPALLTEPHAHPDYLLVRGLDLALEPRPWPSVAHDLDPDLVRPWVLGPVYEQIVSGQGQFLAEIRPVVALFLRFGAIDYDHVADAPAQLDALTRRVQHVLAQNEGTVLQVVVGDKGQYLYAIFGAPLAHEDDAARAVRAALQLSALAGEFAALEQLQIGISQGKMLVNSYGNSTFRTYSALGDEANVAARLMMRAEPGQILVTQHVAETIEHLYVTAPLETITLKGKQKPLPVACVQRARVASSAAPRRVAPVLVGREAECAHITERLSAACSGKGGLVLVEGEAGIGKSHLTGAVLTIATGLGVQTVFGVCQSTDGQSSYAPWQQLLRALFQLEDDPDDGSPRKFRRQQIRRVLDVVHELNPAWVERVPLLSDVLELAIADNATTSAFDARVRQEALVSFVIDLLQTWARRQPLLLVIEDMHWMDELSCGLVLALSRVVAHVPLLLLLTQRPPQDRALASIAPLYELPHASTLGLGELTPPGVAAFLAHHLQAAPPPLLVAVIQARTQGNPFFIEELLSALIESGRLVADESGAWHLSETMMRALQEGNCLDSVDGAWVLAPDAPLGTVYLGLPDSVRGVVLARIDRLPESHRLTLKVASAIGHIFDFDILRQAHPLHLEAGVLREQIDLLEAYNFAIRELPGPQLSYTFKHNIIQEVAYETLLETQQQELHAAVGEALRRLYPDAVEQLAHHYSRSGQRDQALWYLELAARKAQRAYANETALGYYARALAIEERWQWRKGQIEILHLLGRRSEQFAALRVLGTTRAAPTAEVAFQWGLYYQATSDYVQASAYMARALEDHRQASNRIGEMLALRELGMIARSQGEYDTAKRWYQEGLVAIQKRPASSDEEKYALAQILIGLGTVHRQQSEFAAAREHYLQALQVYRETGNRWGEAQALNALGGIAYYQRLYAEARDDYAQALLAYRSIGDRAKEGICVYNLGLVSQELGEYTAAEQYLTYALEVQQNVGNRWEEVNIWNVLGTLYHQMGDLAEARRCLEKALGLSLQIGMKAGEAYVLANLGTLCCDSGAFDEAEGMFGQGLELARAQNDQVLISHFLSHLGILMLRREQFEQAGDYARQAWDLRQKLALEMWTTADLATLAQASLAQNQPDQARDYVAQASQLLDRYREQGLESPVRDYWVCSRVYTELGEQSLAAAAFTNAYDLVLLQAAKLSDQRRTMFLHEHPLHQTIMRQAESKAAAVCQA
jgi:adenylate cyclase